MEAFKKWTEYLDAGNGIDIIYLDYTGRLLTLFRTKARLLTKLQQTGISIQLD